MDKSKIHYGMDRPVCGKGWRDISLSTDKDKVNCRHCLYLTGERRRYSAKASFKTTRQEILEFKRFMAQYYAGWDK